ncbi:MAG: exodeoxyribonuclease VII large subunit [Microthrixaceae bacterium]
MARPGASGGGAGAEDAPVPTWSIAELHEALNGLFVHVFGDEVWVEGELCNMKRAANSHVFFDLVDPGRERDSNRPMLSVTLFSTERQAVNRHLINEGGRVRMDDGVRVRIRGRLNVSPRSRLQLRMSWIDPAYTLGVMGADRDRVLAALAAEDLLGRNALVPMATVPLHVAIVTSIGSAAHADALDELMRSQLGFRVSVVDARTQGAQAERSIVAALGHSAAISADVVLLVRGGGARTDLAAFDSEAVARAIAASAVPVLTGVGHEVDRTVADEVAHIAHKTPTAAAASVVAQVRRTAQTIEDAAAQFPVAAHGRLARSVVGLDQTAQRAGRAATHRLGSSRQAVDQLAQRVTRAAPRRLSAPAAELRGLAERVAPATRRQLDQATLRLDATAARARAHDPALAAARGWSITRGPDGRVVRSVRDVAEGDELITTLADGTLHSVLASARPTDPTDTQEQA